MRPILARPATCAFAAALALFALAFAFQATTSAQGPDLRKGRAIFRFDTFGDEQLWTTVLRMHEVLPTVDPVTALGVGLKVDAEALPRAAIDALRSDGVDLTDPVMPVELLNLDATVGRKA